MALEVGSIVEGRITGVKKFGAFVALPENKTGLVHISEVSHGYIEDLETVLSDGQTVRVQILSIAPDGKIALSIKRTLPPPERTDHGTPHGGPRSGGAPNGGAGQRRGGPRKEPPPRVWQPKPVQAQQDLSFEDMMSQYKSRSEEKIADLKRATENHRGGGYSRRR